MTPDQVLKELRRELGMRRSCYPRWVKEGKLSQATADHRIEVIEWAIGVIEEGRPPEPEQQSLFEISNH